MTCAGAVIGTVTPRTSDSENRGGQSQVEAMFSQINAATISLSDTPEPLHTIDAQTEAYLNCMHPIWECDCGETSQFLCDCFEQEPQYCNCYGPIPAPAAGVAIDFEIRDMREAFQSQPRFVDTLHEWVYSRGVDQVTVLDMNDDENDIDDDVVPDLPDAKDAFDADEAAVREAEQRWGRASPSGVKPPASTGTPAKPPMATPFQEPYSFPKNSALDALRGNDTARTGGADVHGKTASTPISAAEHQALATVAQERKMRKLQDAVIRMKASPIRTAIVEVTKQTVKLMRAPVQTVFDNITNWQLIAMVTVGLATWPRARGPIIAIALRIVTSARVSLTEALSGLSLKVRVWVVTMLLKMIGQARTSGGSNTPAAPASPMAMTAQTQANSVLEDVWSEALLNDTGASEFMVALQTARNHALPMAVMIFDNEEHDMFMSCQYCGIYHTPDSLWCPESMGMTALPPPAGNFGCTLSSHERWCTCPMREWRNEMAAHTRALIARYSEMVSRRLEREAAYADAARTFVCNSIESALRLLFPIETHMLPHRVIDDREWTIAPDTYRQPAMAH